MRRMLQASLTSYLSLRLHHRTQVLHDSVQSQDVFLKENKLPISEYPAASHMHTHTCTHTHTHTHNAHTVLPPYLQLLHGVSTSLCLHCLTGHNKLLLHACCSAQQVGSVLHHMHLSRILKQTSSIRPEQCTAAAIYWEAGKAYKISFWLFRCRRRKLLQFVLQRLYCLLAFIGRLL